MNRIVAVPNWSFYDPSLCFAANELLEKSGVLVHYCQGDEDHQRSVIAFSGLQSDVFESMTQLASLLLPKIDLGLQQGVHPRVGALDVAPFVLLEGSEPTLVLGAISWAKEFSKQFDVPVHLYEKAAEAGNEYRLPYLRGQVGNLEQLPDFGSLAHRKWGTSIVGVRDFLLAANLNYAIDDLSIVKDIAREIRLMRDHGNPALSGVRALGFPLKAQGMTQLSLNFTDPDNTSFDSVLEIINELLDGWEVFMIETELIGIIRPSDVAKATQLSYEPSQVVS